MKLVFFNEFQVIWHHNGSAINITSERGGLSIQTDREGRSVVSRLSVVRATPRDAGLYKCAPDLVNPANATVFVVEGEFFFIERNHVRRGVYFNPCQTYKF